MIGRIWRGWTRRDDAGAYQRLLREEIGPGVRGRAGCEGFLVLRRVGEETGDGVEFVTITLFRSLDSARSFSKEGDRGAVVPAAARRLLGRFDEEAAHHRLLSRLPERP